MARKVSWARSTSGARLEELAQVCGEAGLVLLAAAAGFHLEIAQLGPQWLGVVLPVDSSASQPPGRRHHGRADIDGGHVERPASQLPGELACAAADLQDSGARGR